MIRRLLHALLTPRAYLRVVSRAYFVSFRAGWLRTQPAYFAHYLVDVLVREGDVVVDIGANLGYFTVPFADRVGPSGKVWAVEPVALFRDVLAINLAGRTNVEVLPYALGQYDGLAIEMGVPGGHRHFRHGLTRVLAPGERTSQSMVFAAVMRQPMRVFGDLQALDYVKCDVEGHESHILPAMATLFERFRPIVQVETTGESRERLLDLFASLGYDVFAAGACCLQRLASGPARTHAGDLLFIPPTRSDRLVDVRVCR